MHHRRARLVAQRGLRSPRSSTQRCAPRRKRHRQPARARSRVRPGRGWRPCRRAKNCRSPALRPPAAAICPTSARRTAPASIGEPAGRLELTGDPGFVALHRVGGSAGRVWQRSPRSMAFSGFCRVPEVMIIARAGQRSRSCRRRVWCACRRATVRMPRHPPSPRSPA